MAELIRKLASRKGLADPTELTKDFHVYPDYHGNRSPLADPNMKGMVRPKFINPLLPIAHKSARIGKISILKLEGIIKKISYERRDYESVDEKSLSKAMSRKNTKKRIQALKG